MRFLGVLFTSALAFSLGALGDADEETRIQAELAAVVVTNVDDVRGNLYLPTTADSGDSILWTSSDESIISCDGIVRRQQTDAQVTLTAAIKSDGAQAERRFIASVRAAVKLDPFEGYSFLMHCGVTPMPGLRHFLYFTGSTLAGENIFLAASNGNNALSWEELNGGEPILTSSYGTKGLRDPFVIRSPEGDTFYVLATDLSIGSGTSWSDAVRWGSRYIEIWESHDLKTWSNQRHVLVSPPEAGNTWAPEAYYDNELGSYVVFWASELYDAADVNRTGSTYNRMLYSTTRDFVTFSEPQIWQDAGMSRIDSTVLKWNDVYYRFSKDEGYKGTGCSDIIQENSTSLLATLADWGIVASCIGKNAGTSAVEGPTSFKSNPGDVNGDKFYLFLDEYTGRGYIPLETADIANPEWKVSSSYSLPSTPRHGTVLPVTAAELSSLTASSSKPRSASANMVSSARKERKDRIVARDSPVLPGYYADPNIAVYGDTYYIYPTTDGFPNWGGQVFYAWSSKDLVNWSRPSEPFLVLNGTSGNVPWATGNAWAPTIIERYGKYYFYFSGQNPTYDRKTIGVAIADHPEGPFTAEPTAMILNNEALTTSQAIDSATFLDPETGIYWLLWGNGTPLLAQLNDDMISINWDTVQSISGLTDFREGIFLVYRQGLYHMTYSIDDTRSENYRVGYATSTNVTGPYSYQGVVLQKNTTLGILATGHDSILNVPGTDEWYIAYHRFAIPNGNGTERETTIDKVTFDPDTGLMQTVIPTLTSVDPFPVPGYC